MNQPMSFTEAISSVFHQYADFSGRARRSEYWYFCLFNGLVYLGISILYSVVIFAGVSSRSLSAALGGSFFVTALYGIYSLAVLIPGLAVACRRLHDIGRAGSYLLFAFIPLVGFIFLLIWFLQEGDHGSNQYGADPKGGYTDYSPAPVRHHSPSPEPVRNVRQYQEQPSSLYLEGTSGHYFGRRIPIRGTMVAGRDSGCDISFPGDTHGVSHRHCRIQADGSSSLIVTDLGSSCGTFINGSNRLKANHSVSLSPGDTIGLGSQKQSFKVRQHSR